VSNNEGLSILLNALHNPKTVCLRIMFSSFFSQRFNANTKSMHEQFLQKRFWASDINLSEQFLISV
jgi:hypothetical protein